MVNVFLDVINNISRLLISLRVQVFISYIRQTENKECVLEKNLTSVYDTGPTLSQHWFTALCLLGVSLRQLGIFFFSWSYFSQTDTYTSVMSWFNLPQPYIRQWPNAGVMLAQRCKRWTDIEPTLGQHLISPRPQEVLNQCWINVGPALYSVTQH